MDWFTRASLAWQRVMTDAEVLFVSSMAADYATLTTVSLLWRDRLLPTAPTSDERSPYLL